jgi:hypothetical protein
MQIPTKAVTRGIADEQHAQVYEILEEPEVISMKVGTRGIEEGDGETTGIEAVGEGEIKPYDVYDQSGRMVLHQVTSLEGLSNGVYIVNGKKVLKK